MKTYTREEVFQNGNQWLSRQLVLKNRELEDYKENHKPIMQRLKEYLRAVI